MNLRIFLAIFALGIAALVGATPAQAQATRTWVSGVGDDVNPCSRTAPCKTFAGAISKTAAGGEINCLDPGGYGAVTITKSMTIDCEDTQGSILASSTTGVIVNGAGIIVNLRGLSINGGTPTLPGVNGVRYLQGARLNIEECVIFNFAAAAPSGHGVRVDNTSGSTNLVIRNSVIRNNGTAVSGSGLSIANSGTGAARVTLENVTLSGNFRGIDVSASGSGAVTMMLDRIQATVNSSGGISISAGPTTFVQIRDSVLSNNTGTGLNATGNATVLVGNTSIFNNTTGIAKTAPASVLSYGDNLLNLNGTDGTFSGPAGKS